MRIYLLIASLLCALGTSCTHGPTKRDTAQEDILSSKATNPGNYSLVGPRRNLDKKILKRGKQARFTSSLDSDKRRDR